MSLRSKRLIVASFNILKHLSESRTLDDFGDLLSQPGLDIAGLQEIDWDIEASGALPDGWTVHQTLTPGAARKDPIVHRTRYRAVDSGCEQLHAAIYHDGGVAPARYASWRSFEDFHWINLHLNADVEDRPGHPKQDSPRPEANHAMMRRVIALANRLQRKHSVPVFVSGDFNVDYVADRRVRNPLFPYVTMTGAGFVCCWEGREAESTRTNKPRNGRCIDYIWARGSKTHRVKWTLAYTPNRWGRGDRVESDHLAVIAHAVIRPRIKPWLFNLLGKRKRRSP